jgi:CRISPR-associated protein Cmr2
MNDALLIFTFSPIQSFIAEARRVSDLYAGSKILSRLAFQVAQQVVNQGGDLIYPAQTSQQDMPNKLVTLVPYEQGGKIAQSLHETFLNEWQQIADDTLQELSRLSPAIDEHWRQIWQRQSEHFWEIYWVVQKLSDGYASTYQAAARALEAVKRTRAFAQTAEEGLKDSLSGKRAALTTRNLDARQYWSQLAQSLRKPSLLRGDGRERLDALGAIKRFSPFSQRQKFLSVSSVATADFLAQALQNARGELDTYRQTVAAWAYPVREQSEWPYDGDLFFLETLTAERLAENYGLQNPDPQQLSQAKTALSRLYKAVFAPSPYYAILQLDGDSIGEIIDSCQTVEQHHRFSQSLITFAQQVKAIVDRHLGELIYNGGDDVLALAPISRALPLASELAHTFSQVVKRPNEPSRSCTLSAGIVIAHHLYPLDAALSAARQAEQDAKSKVKEKNAVCVSVMRRSGEFLQAFSPWQAMGNRFDELVALLKPNSQGVVALASGFAYEAAGLAYALPEANERLQSQLCRLLTRHRNAERSQAFDPRQWSQWLTDWAGQLPEQTTELGKWLLFARFVARGGAE